MAILVKGIISFPKIFTPQKTAGFDKLRYSTLILFPPTDPQVTTINQIIKTEIQNTFPHGLPHNSDVCFMAYDQKFQGKEYYDPRFSGYWVLSAGVDAGDGKPVVVDENLVPIIDPGAVYSGCVAEVHVNIKAYIKGKGGVSCYLNGVKFSGEEGPFGRLDGRPTVDQMFGGASQTHSQAPSNPVPVAPAAPNGRQMTAKANGVPYETFIANNWTDAALIEHGYMLPPGNTALLFK